MVEASVLLASVVAAAAGIAIGLGIGAAVAAVPHHPPLNSTDSAALRSYITPHEPGVVRMVDEVLEARQRRADSDFEALSQWVATNIRYVSDREAHGVDEHFQLPLETIELGSGDCEDFAFLLCSLLRARGVPADQVYVVVEEPSGGEYLHAYLLERWSTGRWRAVEPQQGEVSALAIGDVVDFWGEHRIRLCFNDEKHLTGEPERVVMALANNSG